MRYPFDSEEAQQLNKDIFETIYYAALEASCEIAEKNGAYETYEGSPVSKGVTFLFLELFLQFKLIIQTLKFLKLEVYFFNLF